ncbi:MAG: response regulator transcription factor [Erysipelothrix sp.]|nr:response regulator transcription factor [Erysipelothrix sp.]
MIKVLIIEDEDSIRRLVRYDLKQSNYHVESSADGQEGYQMALDNTYDVVLIDWMLPGKNGLEIVSDLRNNEIDSILIMLTAKDEEEDILDAFEAGVDDYVTKPFSTRQLQARIKAHLARFDSKDNNVQLISNLKIDRDRYEVSIDQQPIHLTKKEYDLLLYLVDHIDHVVSREQILNDIWNFDYDGDTRIVDVHIFKLRTKLAQSKTEINSIRGVGYVFKTI